MTCGGPANTGSGAAEPLDPLDILAHTHKIRSVSGSPDQYSPHLSSQDAGTAYYGAYYSPRAHGRQSVDIATKSASGGEIPPSPQCDVSGHRQGPNPRIVGSGLRSSQPPRPLSAGRVRRRSTRRTRPEGAVMPLPVVPGRVVREAFPRNDRADPANGRRREPARRPNPQQ